MNEYIFKLLKCFDEYEHNNGRRFGCNVIDSVLIGASGMIPVTKSGGSFGRVQGTFLLGRACSVRHSCRNWETSFYQWRMFLYIPNRSVQRAKRDGIFSQTILFFNKKKLPLYTSQAVSATKLADL